MWYQDETENYILIFDHTICQRIMNGIGTLMNPSSSDLFVWHPAAKNELQGSWEEQKNGITSYATVECRKIGSL